MELRAYVEAAIDFPDEDAEFLATPEVRDRLAEINAQFAAIAETVRQGRALRDGLHVVIAGRPNAGKSSLLNALAGFDAAIVTAIPGTTRDLLRERIHVDGLPIHVVDTAGLRDTDDVIEIEGVRRARMEMSRADLVLYVVDATLGFAAGEQGDAARRHHDARRLEQGGPAGRPTRAGARGSAGDRGLGADGRWPGSAPRAAQVRPRATSRRAAPGRRAAGTSTRSPGRRACSRWRRDAWVSAPRSNWLLEELRQAHLALGRSRAKSRATRCSGRSSQLSASASN
mgnify:CR=1 FL=1